MVALNFAPHAKVSRVGVDARSRGVTTALQRRDYSERLDRGARLKHIDNGPITHPARLEIGPIIGVEGRLIDQRQDIASGNIDHDHRRGRRLRFLHGTLQRSIGEVLDA